MDHSRPFHLALGSLALYFWDLKMAPFTLNLVPEDREMQWFGLGSPDLEVLGRVSIIQTI